tara:strand:+ start:12828 stop:14600 length:1773 start_codon:yes stop_codon:yes gene_type:complete
MHLNLTANKSYWKLNKDDIFLGEWCFKNINERKKYKESTIKYHWSNNEDILSDCENILETYEDIIPKLSNYLNTIHNLNFNQNYWEKLVGLWLIKFIDFVYDKYKSLDLAFSNYNIKEVTLAKKYYSLNSFDDFYEFSSQDDFNFYIYSKIINILNYNVKKIDVDNTFDLDRKKNIKKQKKNVKFYIKKIIFFNTLKKANYNLYKFIGSRYNDFQFLNLAFNNSELKYFAKILNIYHYKLLDYERINFKTVKSKKISRLKSLKLDKKNDFYKLLDEIIPLSIPREYCEFFDGIRIKVKSHIPKKIPKIIFVRSSLEQSTFSRFFQSELSKLGSKIYAFQEGGGNNTRYNNIGDHKMHLIACDKLLTWGWKINHNKIQQFKFTKTFWIKKFKYCNNKKILICGASCRRYHFSIFEGNFIHHNNNHLFLNRNLLKYITKLKDISIIYRLHKDFEYNEREYLDEFENQIKFSSRESNEDFYDLLYSSSLIINTSDYTANLQSLIINIPTIFLWNKEDYKIRDISKKFYEDLYENGILYFDSSECAKKIKSIYHNPLKWWYSSNVQMARKNFIKNFCNYSGNLKEDLLQLKKNL